MSPKLDQRSILLDQGEMIKAIKSLPPSGKPVTFQDRVFVVHRNVFIPNIDTTLLIENLRIKKGEGVLDVGTGAGVVAVIAALTDAARVLAVDWNRDAVSNAKLNVSLHNVQGIVEVRVSDVFSNLGAEEKFDVIVANLPFMNRAASDIVETAIWDTGLYTNRTFFCNVGGFLSDGGRVYFTQANFGALRDVLKLARRAGFYVKKLAERSAELGKVFYLYELTRVHDDRIPPPDLVV